MSRPSVGDTLTYWTPDGETRYRVEAIEAHPDAPRPRLILVEEDE